MIHFRPYRPAFCWSVPLNTTNYTEICDNVTEGKNIQEISTVLWGTKQLSPWNEIQTDELFIFFLEEQQPELMLTTTRGRATVAGLDSSQEYSLQVFVLNGTTEKLLAKRRFTCKKLSINYGLNYRTYLFRTSFWNILNNLIGYNMPSLRVGRFHHTLLKF